MKYLFYVIYYPVKNMIAAFLVKNSWMEGKISFVHGGMQRGDAG
jgi:hypothetical protein